MLFRSASTEQDDSNEEESEVDMKDVEFDADTMELDSDSDNESLDDIEVVEPGASRAASLTDKVAAKPTKKRASKGKGPSKLKKAKVGAQSLLEVLTG